MRTSVVILVMLGAPRVVVAVSTEPSPPPAPTPLKVETPVEQPTEQADLPTGALLRIGSVCSPRMLEGRFTFSPDGKLIATGTAGHFVRVWEVATGRALHNLGPFAGSGMSTRIIEKAVFAPDGKSLVVASGMKAHLFDLTTGKEIGRLEGHEHVIEDIMFAADGKKLVTGAFDNTVAIWDRATFKRLHSLTGFTEAVRHVTISDDGAIMAAASRGKVKLWRASDGTALRDLAGLISETGFLQFADDGKMLLACGQEEGLIAWDVVSGESKRRVGAMKGMAMISPDGSHLAVAQSYGSSEPIVIWDVKSGKPIAKIKGNQGGIHTMCFAADNQTLATYGGDGFLRPWKVPGGEEINRPAGHQNRITGIGFSRDGKKVISASEDGTVRFWDAVTRKELMCLSAPNEHFHNLALSPDAKTLVLVGRSLPVRWHQDVDEAKQSSTLRFVAIDSGKEIRSFDFSGETNGAIRFTADGRELLAVNWSGARLIDPLTGKSRDLGVSAEQGLAAADIAPHGRYVAVSTNLPGIRQIGKIAFIDTKDNREVFSKIFHLGGYNGLAFTPDGRHLAVSSHGHFANKETNPSPLELWEVPGDRVVRKFETSDDYFHSLLFSRDGRLLAAVKQGRIEVFEVATGKRRHEFAGHEGGVGAIAFSRDGGRLVSGGIDGRVMVWDLIGASGRPTTKLEPKDLDQLWHDLSSNDSSTANAAIGRLAGRPLESMPYLRRRMTVSSDADVKRMEALMVDLDSDEFRVRDRAAKELEKLGEAAVPVLKRALIGSSAEVQQTAKRLLGKIGDGEDAVASPEARRALRVVEILERIGNADATALLKDLRRRGGRLILHSEADAALTRIERD